MKKIIALITISLLGIISANAELSLTTSDIKKATDNGYILSDNYVTYNECEAQRVKNNMEYTSYKRSECFKDETGYKYFICKLTDSCTIVGGTVVANNASSNTTLSTANTTVAKIANQDKLDKFLSKVVLTKGSMSTTKYEKFLDTVLSKLKSLGTKYSSNTSISEMVNYLVTGVQSIQEEFLKNKDVDNFFCELTDSCISEQSSVDYYMSNVGPNDLSSSTLNGTACREKALYGILDGVDKSNPPKGCAKPAGAAGCDTLAGFRDYTAAEWVSNTRIVTTAPANAYPAGSYEFYIAYGNDIKKVGSGTLKSCGSSSNGGTEKYYISNVGPNDTSSSNLNGTACNENAFYGIIDGVSKTNPPKGCAKPASWATLCSANGPNYNHQACIDYRAGKNKDGGCSNVSEFRDYTAAEWASDTRIVTSGPANVYPLGDYEFYISYGNNIKKVGSGTLKSCGTTSSTTTTQSCYWSGIVVGPEATPTTTCNASSAGSVGYNDRGTQFTCTCVGGTNNSSTSLSEKVYASNEGPNDLSNLNGTVCQEKPLYIIMDGVSKSNPPKGCAKPAGAAGCDTLAGFRDYTAAEWVSNTRIVTTAPASAYPVGNYEFYVVYGNNIKKVGTGSLKNCNGTVNYTAPTVAPGTTYLPQDQINSGLQYMQQNGYSQADVDAWLYRTANPSNPNGEQQPTTGAAFGGSR